MPQAVTDGRQGAVFQFGVRFSRVPTTPDLKKYLYIIKSYRHGEKIWT